ncbi:4-hydroxy-3-methylbut-2-enyl diphosphate reductase [Flaviaesturariibacter flavus]|uniref:4-hydroxy-3-methylbut-2-enyl diphosphate reductase n=2 Tax=Flaviaesturariibacter flavus TaxID=2502780 RepID=A0A4R1B3I9_9BACT|nr:4-hydroxy-3-methylbut-2-enyl diphosphate reductase [Flaviaesturariibacter flavus]
MKTFDVPIAYRSPLISAIKKQRKEADRMKKDFTPTLLDFGPVRVYLARHFGFCYGVENAIDIAFRTVVENEGKRIFLLSEMIHNPQVNADLLAAGVRFLQDTKGNPIVPFEDLTSDDIVLIPAFGTTLEIDKRLNAIGIRTEQYNTTCPFVEKVWNRSEGIAQKGYSIIIHGKPKHEETRATFSHAAKDAPSVVVKDMQQTLELAKYITGEKPASEFYTEFKGQFSEGFDVERDLQRIGVVNQTTMLASDTQAIADYLRDVMIARYGLTDSDVRTRFADTRDTLCYATNDNQTAVQGMLQTPADLAIVVGGYNSSNTSHLVELCEEALPTYYINEESKLLNRNTVHHYNFHNGTEHITENYLPEKEPLTVLITSGASCPDAVVEGVIRRLVSFFPGSKSIEDVATQFA